MKTLKQAISLALSVLLVASALFIGATAETADTVTATELPVSFYNGTNNANISADTTVDGMAPTYGNVYSAAGDLDPLVPEFRSTRLTFGWSKEGNKYNADDIKSFYATEGVDLSNQGVYRYFETVQVTEQSLFDDVKDNIYDISNDNLGLMLYVRLDPESNDTGLYIESQSVAFNDDGTRLDNVQLFSPIVKGQTYYLMAAGSDEWVLKDTNDIKYGLGSKSNSQALNLPAGYEGWIYLPRNAFINTTHATRPYTTYKWLYRINFYLNEITKDTPVQFSNIMLVNGNVIEADGVTTGDKTYAFADNRFYSGTDLDVNGVEMSRDGFYGFTNKDGQLAASYGADNASLSVNMGADKNVVIAPDSYYTATPSAAADNLARDQRPKTTSHWAPMQVLSSSENEFRYDVKLYAPDPFGTGGYSREDTNSKIPTTLGVQYDKMFADNGAYIGGFYRTIATNNTSTANSLYASAFNTNFNSLSVTDKAVMFYIKHTYAEGIEDKQSINIVPMLQNFYTKSGMPYYVYNSATQSWSKATFNAHKDGMVSAWAESGDYAYGYIEVPVDFEGWYLIPYDSYTHNSSPVPSTVTEFRITFDRFGMEYGEFTFGNIALVDNINPLHVTENSVFISSNSIALASDFPFDKVETKTDGSFTNSGGNGAIQGLTRDKTTFTVDDTFNVTVSGEGNAKSVVWDFTGEKMTLSYLNITTNSLPTTGYNSVVTYVNNESDSRIVAIVGNNGNYYKSKAKYHLLSKDSSSWNTYYSSEASYSFRYNTVSPSGATIVIPANFEGWISFELSSFSGTDSYFSRFSFFPIEMSGSVTFTNPFVSTGVTPKYHPDISGNYVGVNSSLPNLVPYDPANTKTVTVADGVLTNESDSLYATFNVSGTANAGEAIMFYAKNNAETSVIFKSSVGDNASVSAYSTDAREWTLVSADGKATLPANFEGWVKIAVATDTEFDSINLTFNSLTNGFAISDLMVANYSDDLEFTKRGTSVRTGLFYEKGDFNLDAKTDILDAVLAKSGYEAQHDITKFNGDQLDGLRKYILNN